MNLSYINSPNNVVEICTGYLLFKKLSDIPVYPHHITSHSHRHVHKKYHSENAFKSQQYLREIAGKF